MDELDGMRVFVQVVDGGSFSAAARQADASVSSIARHVKALEDSLGTRLLNKTTRQQALTEAGRIFYGRAKAILDEVDRARRDVSSFQSTVKGLLRVYLRSSAGSAVIAPALPEFLVRHPEVTLDVTLADERVDLVANSIDVAVWLGHLDDSSMIARRLSPSRRVVCGSPQYFARRGVPAQPTDLAGHNCLVYKASHYGNVWRFTKGGDKVDVTATGNLQTSSGSVLMTTALAGLGLMVVQEWMVRSVLQSGRLLSVLTDYDVSPTEYDTALYAVYPHGRGLSLKTRAFVDFLVELFREREPAVKAVT